MSRAARAVALPVAGGASLALHLGMAGLLALAIAPKPFAPQLPPPAKLAVEAYQVDRSDAAETRPEADVATEESAAGDAAAQGAVPQSRAEPVVPPPEKAAEAASAPERIADSAGEEVAALAPAPAPAASLAPAQAAPAPIAASRAPAAALAPAETPAAALAPSTAPSASLAAEAPAAIPAEAAAPPAAALAETEAAILPAVAAAPDPAALPAAETAPVPAAATRPEAAPSPAVAAEAADLAAAVPEAAGATDGTRAATEALPDTPPPAEKGTATLAWAGPDGTLDPKSLDAIQAFMQPGDASAATSEVRDGIEGLLASVPCARLQVEFDPATGSLVLRGHIPEDGLRGPVLAALEAQVGTGIPVTQDLRILPRPQCGALSGIGAVGLPQSTELQGNPRIIGSDGYVAEEHYTAGEYVNFTMQGLDYPAYVYVDYFAADGSVIHLVPNETVPLTLLPAKGTFRIGSETPGPGELQLQVGPPYGQEIAVAFAASVPLYDGLRPLVEPADPYLAEMTARVAEARAKTPDFKGEWVYFFIATTEN